MDEITNNIDSLIRLAREHYVEKMEVFGSIAKESYNKESDIDLLILFKRIPIEDYAINFFSLESRIKELFDRDVDIVTVKGLKNRYFIETIRKEKITIYEEKDFT